MMRILKNNVKELVIWILYIIGIIFIPLEQSSLYIYVIGLIVLRILGNTHKLFGQVNFYSKQIKKYEYNFRMVAFVSVAILGILSKEDKTDSLMFDIATITLFFTVIFIFIWELTYLLQKILEEKEKKAQQKFQNQYDKIIFESDIYILTYITDLALIRKLAYIITDFGIGSERSNFNNLENMIKELKIENYIFEETINMNRGNANILCHKINKLLEFHKINFIITPEMIYKLDNEKIANRRKESISTVVNDINIINNYLEEFNYRVVVLEYYQIHYFALLKEERIWTLNELSVKVS